MKSLTHQKFGSLAVTAVLALGLTMSVSGIASAAKHKPVTTTTTTVAGATTTTTTTIAPKKVALQGVVTAVSSTSLSVVNAKGATTVFTLDATTKVRRSANVKNGVVLAVGQRVEVIAYAATPTVAKSVNILAAKANRVVSFRGVVTATSATSLSLKDAKGTIDTFVVSASTKVLHSANVKHSVTLAIGDRVEVRALSANPTAALTINILGANK